LAINFLPNIDEGLSLMSTTSQTLVVRLAILGALIVTILSISASVGFAEPVSPISDSVNVSVNGLSVAGLSITDAEEGLAFDVLVPGTIIELLEPDGTISDRLIIDPYQFHFQSDAEGAPSPSPRAGAIQVPENFSPLAIRFVSDAENPTGTLSDTVDVFVNGAIVGHFDISELPTEPPLDVTLPPVQFDMMEDPQFVSDILDIGQIHFTFESDAEKIGLPQIEIPHGYVSFSFPELDVNGNGILQNYDMVAVSDPVPEPSSVILLAVGVLAIFPFAYRRRRAARAH
jgi:PEP-CTERM motif